VPVVDFDPQATPSHAMGLKDVDEEHTVWGITARDLIRHTEATNAGIAGAMSGRALPRREIPASIARGGLGALRTADFIAPTCWPTPDIVPSCANAALVEFASAQYRHPKPDRSFHECVSGWLDALPDQSYDMVLFDCPSAIGYQSMNAVYAADMLYVPSGPDYREHDPTTSLPGQLAEALADLEAFGAEAGGGPGDLPARGSCLDVRFLLTRFEPGAARRHARRL
jgi:cellulose biosynthesis protein BcsQ